MEDLPAMFGEFWGAEAAGHLQPPNGRRVSGSHRGATDLGDVACHGCHDGCLLEGSQFTTGVAELRFEITLCLLRTFAITKMLKQPLTAGNSHKLETCFDVFLIWPSPNVFGQPVRCCPVQECRLSVRLDRRRLVGSLSGAIFWAAR